MGPFRTTAGTSKTKSLIKKQQKKLPP